jgi:hypothetical protein
MAELRFVATPELKCMFAMVNRIKYTPVSDIVDYFKNVHKMSGPIECTSMVTRIAMNLGCPEMANLAYIEGPADQLHPLPHAGRLLPLLLVASGHPTLPGLQPRDAKRGLHSLP